MKRPDWETIRKEYVGSHIGLRPLAEKHGLVFSTVGKRCAREGWAGERQRFLTSSRVTGLQLLRMEHGMNEASFLKKTICGIDDWLRRIEELAAAGTLDPNSLRSLVQSWRDVVSTGRETFGLDNAPSATTIHIGEKPMAMRLAPFFVVKNGQRVLVDPETELPALPASTSEPKL